MFSGKYTFYVFLYYVFFLNYTDEECLYLVQLLCKFFEFFLNLAQLKCCSYVSSCIVIESSSSKFLEVLDFWLAWRVVSHHFVRFHFRQIENLVRKIQYMGVLAFVLIFAIGKVLHMVILEIEKHFRFEEIFSL